MKRVETHLYLTCGCVFVCPDVKHIMFKVVNLAANKSVIFGGIRFNLSFFNWKNFAF